MQQMEVVHITAVAPASHKELTVPTAADILYSWPTKWYSFPATTGNQTAANKPWTSNVNTLIDSLFVKSSSNKGKFSLQPLSSFNKLYNSGEVQPSFVTSEWQVTDRYTHLRTIKLSITPLWRITPHHTVTTMMITQ